MIMGNEFNSLGDVYDAALRGPGDKTQLLNRIREHKEAERRFYAQAHSLVEALATRGVMWTPDYSLNSLFDSPLEPTAIEAILESIIRLPLEAQSHCLTLLLQAKKPFPGDELVNLYYQSNSDIVKYMIIVLASNGRLSGVDAWIRDIMQNRNYGEHRRILLGLAYLQKNKQGLLDILVSEFTKDPAYTIYSLGRLGGERELTLLKELRDSTPQIQDKTKLALQPTLDKAISQIEKRLSKK
jgi:hypothetical protein